jgi:hypothetical protein
MMHEGAMALSGLSSVDRLVAASAGGADLGGGDLALEQGVQLVGFGGGVAEAAALMSSVAWAWRNWRQ